MMHTPSWTLSASAQEILLRNKVLYVDPHPASRGLSPRAAGAIACSQSCADKDRRMPKPYSSKAQPRLPLQVCSETAD